MQTQAEREGERESERQRQRQREVCLQCRLARRVTHLPLN